MFLDVEGVPVHAVAHGGADGLAIVGLAGVFGNVEIWQQPFETLHRAYRTIAYDHYGTGLTHAPPELVTFERQVDLVGDVLDRFEVNRCVLAGDSSLSTVAVAAAHRWPDRVVGLALVAGKARHVDDERTRRFIAGLRRRFDATLDGFAAVCLPEDERGHLRRWLREIIVRTGPERAAALVESFVAVDVRGLLADLDQPTVVLHGAEDVINPPDGARDLADALPRAELTLLDGVGHVPTLSRPAAVAAAIDGLASPLSGR